MDFELIKADLIFHKWLHDSLLTDGHLKAGTWHINFYSLNLLEGQVETFIHYVFYLFIFISPLFNQVGKLRTSSHLQLLPGQDKAKQCDKNNNTELHINKRTVNNTIEKSVYSVCKCKRVGR
jgi:hypothetical protein